MKKFLILMSCVLFIPFLVNAQQVLFDFDTVPDTTQMIIDDGPEGDITYVRVSQETNNVQEGAGAMRVEWQDRCYDQWGGWIGLNFYHPDSGGVWDFSMYEEFSLWYYVETPASYGGNDEVIFRVILWDAGPGASTAQGDQEVWISFHKILGMEPGWNQIVTKLEDWGDAVAHWNPDAGKAFWNPGWGQTATGNGVLDMDKIRGIRFEFSQEANLFQQEMDSVSGVILFDEFSFQGVKPVNLVFFNGKAVPSEVSLHTGWSGSVEVSNEDAFTAGTNSIKWTTGHGWDGPNFDLATPKNLMLNWTTDSLQFKIKAPSGLGNLTLSFYDVDEDAEATLESDWAFQATYIIDEGVVGFDGTWKAIKVALRDFNRFNGVWSNELGQQVPGEFDSSKVAKFVITGVGQEFSGTVVYLDDIWTGNPEFDWIPPAQVTGVSAVNAEYYNLVIWEDVAGETGEVYNVYASESPITDLKAEGVMKIASNVLENTQTAVHWIFYPLTDSEVDQYYAVECVDASGNVGPAGISGKITNTAKGLPTVSLDPPADFVADADLSEWEANGNMPWILKPEGDPFGHVSTGTVTDENDLTAIVYLAMDTDYLYVAFDVIDDVYAFSADGDWWRWDGFELNLGLYDERGEMHQTAPWDNRGAEPDYKLVFQEDRFFNEFRVGGMENDIIYTNADDNYAFENFGAADYAGEAKIPLDSIVIGDDMRFSPVNGMRIPVEITFHDNDGDGSSTDQWEGNLVLSPINDDNAWQFVWQWSITWIGDTTHMATAVEDNSNKVATKDYALSQNYPNPFNPETTIEYSLANDGLVNVSIYNALGQKLETLVDEYKSAGSHRITFNAEQLSSGVYFYKIEAGDYSKTRKMLLMK